MGLVKNSVIKGSNKSEYKVVDIKKDYTLIEDTANVTNKFIVAYKLEKDRKGTYSWIQGHYYSDIKKAYAFFRKA